MSQIVKRGYVEKDIKEFQGEALERLSCAANDIYYLLNQGYRIKSASEFVGNHYLLSERQRLALVRGITSKNQLENRRIKQILRLNEGCTVNIDGFNTIITLEVALSDSLLLNCMDSTVRDLAGLRGTYRLIDKTTTAILSIGRQLEEQKAGKVIFYLDAPVSNSGRLKELIIELLQEFDFELQVEIMYSVDSILEQMENVVTTDAIILDKCKSWMNLNKVIIDEMGKRELMVDFNTMLNRE